MRCARCGAESPPRFKFCGECGHPLTGPPATSESTQRDEEIAPAVPIGSRSTLGSTPEAERRQLTVMFCDLVGSTPLAEKLDPEELRQVIIAYQEMCAHVIRRFEGYLARYIGDGLLVYFGYPQAHEDDAQRAVRAGLGIMAGLPQLNAQLQQTVKVLQQVPLQIRIGIHTGLVVVGDMGGGGFRDPMAIVGETPNIAARLQGIAEPDTVIISAATYRLMQGSFECRDLGPQKLKGVSSPIPAYRILSESRPQSRFDVRTASGLTPLVGREEELGLLLQRWEKVKEGKGQVVLLSGEAGIGKSRLLRELHEQLTSEPQTRLEFRCSPYYQDSALYPVIDLLQRVLEFRGEDSPQEKVRKLEGALVPSGLALLEVVPLVAALLSLPVPERYPRLALTPQTQREKTQQALLAWLLKETERRLLFMVWEDLQWADPSTLEFLGLLLDQAPQAGIFVLLSYRPDFAPPWVQRPHLTPLTLSRLPQIQAEMMIERVTGGQTLPAEVMQQIVSKTDGVPLFVEELTKTVLESGLVRLVNSHYELTGPLPLLAIPATLADALMARLDRLWPGPRRWRNWEPPWDGNSRMPYCRPSRRKRGVYSTRWPSWWKPTCSLNEGCRRMHAISSSMP
jgi:class 3 adenylate cyclase